MRPASPLQCVVVATDFSAGARRAWRRAQYLPFAPDAEVVLAHVLPPEDGPRDASRVEDSSKALLESHASSLRSALRRLGRADVGVRSVLLAGAPPAEIADAARKASADLIVVGRHGVSNIRKFLLGSTAERVIHDGETRVLVVGPQPAGPYTSPLVALAGDEQSHLVLDAALLVIGPGPRLDTLTAVFVPLEGWLWGGWISSKEILRLRAMTRSRTRDVVERALAPYREAGLRCRTTVRDGEPRLVILAEAKRRRSDLLVLGTHAQAGLARFRLGSIAAHVIRHAVCDVLVARPHEVEGAGA